MILIADSGSTKTDWRLVDDEKKIHQCSTDGFNPYFHSTKEISEAIKHQLIPTIKSQTPNPKSHISNLISQIFFYGAGCSNKDKCNIVELALKKNFSNAG